MDRFFALWVLEATSDMRRTDPEDARGGTAPRPER